MNRTPLLAATVLAALLTGCAGTNPAVGESASVEQAVSRQTSTSDARQRAKVHTELGRQYLLEGRVDIALEEARISVDADGTYAPAHNLLGLVHMALRKPELSEQGFRRALALAGNDPEINNDFGWFLCQNGKARESLAHFKVAINNPLFQSPVKALTNAGLCALVIKDDRQAEDFLSRALRMDRGNLSAIYWLADIAYRENRLPDARARIGELHAQMEPSAESSWLALRIDRKLGDREGEARHMGQLRRKYRESPEYQKMTRGEFD